MEAAKTLEDYYKNPEEDTSLIIEDVRRKLKEIDSQTKGEHKEIESKAKGKKKVIINKFAKDLEGKVKDEDICKEIIHHLSEVSERFIRACLPEKYKQKHRVLNAKKQKKKKVIKEEEKLAAIIMKTPLNSEKEEEEKDKKKQVMLVNVDGSISIKNDADGDPDSESQVTDNSFESSINRPSPWYQQEEQQQPLQEQNYEDKEMEEYSKSNESSLLKDHNLNDNEELEHAYIKENEEISENRINTTTDNDVVNVEFSMSFNKIRKYMSPLFPKIGDNGSIWFHIKVNKKTFRVIHSNFGRIGEDNDKQQYRA